MLDVLIDLRWGQDRDRVETAAAALLREGRKRLPGVRLVGLTDPTGPRLPPELSALLDAERATAYAAAGAPPACLVQLAPLACDPLFLARLLLDRSLPAITVAPPPNQEPDPAWLHWLRRYDQIVPAQALWARVAGLLAGPAPAVIRRRRPRVAVLTPRPAGAICAALGRVAEVEVIAQPGHAPPQLSRYDRVLSIVANTPAHAGVIELVTRHGGAVVLEDACLLAAYANDSGRATRLAEAELGRSLGPEELKRWQHGIVRPRATLLGAVAAAAEPLLVHAAGLAATIAARFGREAALIPALGAAHAPVPLPEDGALDVLAFAAGLAAESCIWAVETLRAWGVPARLRLLPLPPATCDLAALVRGLGLAGQVSIADHGRAASVCAFLAMRGQASLGPALAAAAASGLRCIASDGVLEALDPAGAVERVPDEPSPLLLAEAILAARTRPQPVPVLGCHAGANAALSAALRLEA